MKNLQKPSIAHGWLRAVLAFLFFLVLYILFSSGVAILFKQFNSNSVPENTSLMGLLVGVIIVNACFLSTAYLFRRFIDRRSFFSLGFEWNVKYARNGVFVALFVIGFGTFILWGLGYLHFTVVHFDPAVLLFNIVVFALVAFGEEIFFRGYLLANLMQSVNKWLALGISAVFFMFVHLQNPGATLTMLPILSVFFGGLLFGINYIYTRNLWFGIILHFLWNFLQGPVLSYNVSGTAPTGIFNHNIAGPGILTGGIFGFEGSIICIALSVVSIIVLVFLHTRKIAVSGDPDASKC